MSDDHTSLHSQLANAEENLRLIHERKSEYVQQSDIPLQLIREERRLEQRIAELRAELGEPDTTDATTDAQSTGTEAARSGNRRPSWQLWASVVAVVTFLAALAGLGADSLNIWDRIRQAPTATFTTPSVGAIESTAALSNTPESASITTNTLTIQESGVGSDADVHLIAGDTLDTYAVGDDLVVYSSTATGVEIPVALLRVIGVNPDTLSAQTIFADPDFAVKANLRVDARTEQLNNADLIPVPFIPAVGYLLDEGSLYITPDAELAEGDTLYALELVTQGEQIVDALRDSSVTLRVTGIGVLGNTASVELERGEWPNAGTLLSAATATSQNATSTVSAGAESAEATHPTPTNTSASVPTSTPTGTPVAFQQSFPVYETFDGAVTLDWETAQGNWGIIDDRLTARGFVDGSAVVILPHPAQPAYTIQMDVGTFQHLDDSGDPNVSFSYVQILVNAQENTDGYRFVISNGGVGL